MRRIIEAARDPDCLMCLTPDDGGAWWSRLEGPGGIFPSTTPRNFAVDPAAWYDARARFAALGLDDFQFEFVLKKSAPGYVFAVPTGYAKPLGAVITTGGVLYIEGSLSMSGYWYVNSISDFVNKKITILRRSQATSPLVYVDDAPVQVWRSGIVEPPIAVTFMTEPATKVDCDPAYFELCNLTAGKIVWSYPSESERLRLITNTNVLNAGTHFEAANPALGWSIKTGLPTGLTGTVLAMINNIIVTNPSQWSRATATFSGAATDKLDWLAVYNSVLPTDRIAYLTA